MREMLRVMRQVNSSSSLVRTIPVFSNDQLRSDAMVSVLGESMSKPAHVLPMSVASLSSQIFKLTSLSLGLGRWISQAIALLGEAAVFRASSWAVSLRNPRDNLLDAQSYGRTVLDLGIFKMLHGLLPAQNIVLRNGVQATGMLAAEEVAYAVTPDPVRGDGRGIASRFAQAFATSLEMEVGLGFAGLASGHRMEMLRKSVEYTATVIAEGGRFGASDRSSSEHEILSMHSPYRIGELKEILNPSALHARLLDLERLEARSCCEEEAVELWRIFTEVKSKVLKPEGDSKSERELLRYAAVKTLLVAAHHWTRIGGDAGQLRASLGDPELQKGRALEYLNFEIAANPLENSGASSQALRDYLNSRPWNEEGIVTDQEFSLIKSPKENILLRLSELHRLSERLSGLSFPQLWRRLVQLRDVAQEPQGRTLEERERIRYMAVLGLLKLSNELRQKTELGFFKFRDVEALLSNLALANSAASDFLHYEIESNAQNVALKDRVLKFKRWEDHEDDFHMGYFLPLSALSLALATRFSIDLWHENADRGLVVQVVQSGVLGISTFLIGVGVSFLVARFFSLVSVGLLDLAGDARYKMNSHPHQSLRDYLQGEPWREIEVPSLGRVRAIPESAETVERDARDRDDEARRASR